LAAKFQDLTPADRTAPPPGTDLDLEALLSGDEATFEQLVRQESPRLFRIINRIVEDQDEAQSLMQETFLQAFQRLDSFRREAKFTTWVYAIGINLARGSLRKSRRLTALDEAAVERMQPQFERGMFVDQTETWDPHKLAELSQRKDLVHQAIAQLPEDYRTVLNLRDIEEIDTGEVARILDISNGAVRVRLHRARQALRSLLDSHFRV
jgi:RNA polymerase sigma-70 factor (ECF subfamily)